MQFKLNGNTYTVDETGIIYCDDILSDPTQFAFDYLTDMKQGIIDPDTTLAIHFEYPLLMDEIKTQYETRFN